MEGTILKYQVETSDDNKNWKFVKSGEFSNIKSNPIEQFIEFDSPLNSKFFKLVAIETIGEGVSAAEIKLYKDL